jgi:hypothetical protein
MDKEEMSEFLAAAKFPAERAIMEPNAEIRRTLIEAVGPRLFTELDATVIHEDIDGVGNRRRLLRLKLAGTRLGYIQAVEVVCPTTGRVYHLKVPSSMDNCQDAVASTFGLEGSQYAPIRES